MYVYIPAYIYMHASKSAIDIDLGRC